MDTAVLGDDVAMIVSNFNGSDFAFAHQPLEEEGGKPAIEFAYLIGRKDTKI